MNHSNSERIKTFILNDLDEDYFIIKSKIKRKKSLLEFSKKIEILSPNNSSITEKEKEKENNTSNEYNIGNYLIQETIGQGTFGKVKLGLFLPTNERVAIKILEKAKMIEKDNEIRVKREFEMLSKFNHPNVIMVSEIFETSDNFYTIMEYCPGGELFNYIVKKKRLSEKESSFFFYQIINGLEYIHSLGIVHRDLKPENLLLSKGNLIKIIDFGLSNYFEERSDYMLTTPCGSPSYASPEMVAGKKYDGFKVDIWATGIILYGMLCGYLPFEDKNNNILFKKILECKLRFPQYISNTSRDIIEKILMVDPDERITINEIKSHPFYLKGKYLFNEVFTIIENDGINKEKEKEDNLQIEKNDKFEINNNIINNANPDAEYRNKNLDTNSDINKNNNNKDLSENKENLSNTNNVRKNIKELNLNDGKNKIEKKEDKLKRNEKELVLEKNNNSNIKNKKENKPKIKKKKTNRISKDNCKTDKEKNQNEEKNKEKIDKNNNIILSNERNTIDTIEDNLNSINQQKSVTNFMTNNLNDNVNTSYNDERKNNSKEKVKDSNIQSKQSIQTKKNTIDNNNNKEQINRNSTITILDNNKKKIKCLINYYKNNNKIYKNNKNIIFPGKIDKKSKIVKFSKKYVNSYNNMTSSEMEENYNNLFKSINSNNKKSHKLYISKKMNKNNNIGLKLKTNISNIMCDNNKIKFGSVHGSISQNSNSKKKNRILYSRLSNQNKILKRIDNKKINSILIHQKNYLIYNKRNYNLNTKNLKNIVNFSNLNKNLITNHNNSTAISNNKTKKIFKKPSNSIIIKDNKDNKIKNKKSNKFINNNIFVKQSKDIMEINSIISQTEPNIKNNYSNSKEIIRIFLGNKKEKLNSDVNQDIFNKKNNFHSFILPVYCKRIKSNSLKHEKISKRNSKNISNKNSVKKNNYITIRNTIGNISIHDQILLLSSMSQKNHKNCSNKQKTSPKINRIDMRDNSSKKYLERISKSIENNKNISYKNVQKSRIKNKAISLNKEEKNIFNNFNFSEINNHKKLINNMEIIKKTSNQRKTISNSKSKSKSNSKSHSKSKSKSKEKTWIENRNIKNKILILENKFNNCDKSKNKTINKNSNYTTIDNVKNKKKIHYTKSFMKSLKNRNLQINYKKRQNNFNNNIFDSSSSNCSNNKRKLIKYNTIKINDFYRLNIRNSNINKTKPKNDLNIDKKVVKNNEIKKSLTKNKETTSNPSLIKKCVSTASNNKNILYQNHSPNLSNKKDNINNSYNNIFNRINQISKFRISNPLNKNKLNNL